MIIGDVGQPIRYQFLERDPADVTGVTLRGVDISLATTVRIHLRDCDGNQKVFEADFESDGTDGWIEYYTQADTDIDRLGVWEVQGYAESDVAPTFAFRGEAYKATVREAI